MSTDRSSILPVATTPRPASAARETGRGLLRTHVLEALLLALTVCVIAITMVATVRVATNAPQQTEDLTFAGTLRELGLVLESRGADRVARLDRAVLPVGGAAIAVDTVALLVDPAHEPAAASGGFIADHAALYNDHAIRSALIEASLPHAAGATVARDGPSLLRAVWTDDGERRLSDRPSPFALTVRSPYAERHWREVRTSDWRRSGGVLGLEGDVALSADVPDAARARLNGRDCTVRRDGAELLLYCRSTLASDVGRFYDLGFELAGDALAGPTRAFAYRPREIWRNGVSDGAGRTDVRAGDVLDVPPVGPFMLSASERGTLAAGQWINGRHTFANQRLGTLSFFAGAGRSGAGGPPAAPLVLGLDAALSADLEAEAGQFLARRAPQLRRMSVVLVDLRTGELKAIAEPARQGDAEPLLAFEPLLVGSVVKPIVAAAILARRPELGGLALNYAGDTVRVVANVPLRRGFANAANGCAGGIAFDAFLRCSSNQYAAELLVRSLRADGFAPSGTDDVVPRDVLERSALGAGLAEAFDVDAFGFRTAGRNPSLWSDALRDGEPATGNRALLPWESRPWIVFPESDGTRLDLLARYAFGGWENRWTLVGVAEAYARIATGRDVRATILAATGAEDARPVTPHVAAAFRRVRSALRPVAVSGTAAGLTQHLRAALTGDITVLAKTGTLNEETDRFRSLALAIGLAADDAGSAELTCGLVAVTWFEFAGEPGPRRSRTPLPAVHLDFARDALATVLGRHWDRVAGCAQLSAGGTG